MVVGFEIDTDDGLVSATLGASRIGFNDVCTHSFHVYILRDF